MISIRHKSTKKKYRLSYIFQRIILISSLLFLLHLYFLAETKGSLLVVKNSLANQLNSKSKSDHCDSALSLSVFLNKSRSLKQHFSSANPICPFSAYNHFHIAIPLYNLDENTLKESVQSVRGQDYPKEKITIWIYDDASTLPTSKQALVDSCGDDKVVDFLVPMGTSWDHAQKAYAQKKKAVSTWQQSSRSPEMLCFRASQHLGPSGGKYWLFGLIKAFAKPNEVIVVLDGDDRLLQSQSLEIINQKYIDTLCWFTYSSSLFDGGSLSDLVVDRNGEQGFKPREQTWLYGHPHSFKTHLLDHITAEDFKFSDGSWLVKATDRGFVYRMLEISGPDRIGHISLPICKYQVSASTPAQISKEMRDKQIRHTMKMEPSSRLNLDMHVVLLTWERVYLLRHQLDWLQQQTGLKNRRIHLHIVNNNIMEQQAVERIVISFRQIQQQQDDNSSLPMKVTVKHNSGKLYHNFARFIYVEQLRKEVPLDDVIFLDDDQYWQPNFLSSLLGEHRPKGMTTWYGKTFEKDSNGYADYWNPAIAHIDVIRGRKYPQISIFKYGGTGGSIFDTNLWLLNSQLMRPTKDLYKWAKVDDLWSSFVLDALMGWEMRRLTPPAMPVDIGFYREQREYRRIMVKSVVSDIDKLLIGLDIPNERTIRGSAVTRDPTVDKQRAFQELRTFYMWDVVSL